VPSNFFIDLSGRAALVTGGSRGIGAATVRLLARAGADVAFQYHRRETDAIALAEELRRAGHRILPMRGEITEREAVRSMVEHAARELGGLDILVNNAGIWNDGPAGATSDETWDRMIRVNLRSSFLFTECAVPHLLRRTSTAPEGSIVFVSSTAGQRGEAGHSHYAATKGAQIAMTKSLSSELAPRGIRVNCVAPGWVDTEMNSDVFSDAAFRAEVARGIPIGRIPAAEEIAAPIVFLCCDLARHITGEILNVNGGAVLVG
jgi:3-oxoacyl-[acyl-carrier protein] reductase